MTDAASHLDLTIGELFPSGDIVAEWVFSLSAVADDLTMLRRQLARAHAEDEAFRVVLLFQRLLSVRLYEARRLVHVVDTHPELKDFLGSKPPSWFELLREKYSPEGHSAVDELHAVTRHQGVHYMWPGSQELREALHSVGRSPARMKVTDDRSRPNVEVQWVQIVAGMGVFGEVQDAQWTPRFAERGELTVEIVQAWTMLYGVMIVIYAHRRGIDLERFVERQPPLSRAGKPSNAE